MKDPVMVDLSRHDREQSRAEELYELWSGRVIDDLVDRLMDGQAVGGILANGDKLSAADFIRDGLGADFGLEGVEYFTNEQEIALIITGQACTEIRGINDLRDRLADRIRRWCAESRLAQDYIEQRCLEMEDGSI